MSCCQCHMNRREFLGITALGSAAISLTGLPHSYASQSSDWNPHKPLIKLGQRLRVQPVLMYTVSHPKKQRSYKSWGGIQNDESADQEVDRINNELQKLILDSVWQDAWLLPARSSGRSWDSSLLSS